MTLGIQQTTGSKNSMGILLVLSLVALGRPHRPGCLKQLKRPVERLQDGPPQVCLLFFKPHENYSYI